MKCGTGCRMPRLATLDPSVLAKYLPDKLPKRNATTGVGRTRPR